MGFFPWAIVLAAGMGAGATACAALVTPRRLLPWIGLAATAATALLLVGTSSVWRQAPRPEIAVTVGLVGVGACVGGYAFAAALLPATSRHRIAPPVLVVAPDDGVVHTILLADVEYPEYRPDDVTRVLDLYERSDVPLPPYVTRPLIYAAEQARYRRAGGSPARGSVRTLASALAARPEDEAATRVDVAFCNGGPGLAEVIAQVAARGGRRVVVAELTIACTRAFDRAVGDAHALDLSRAGIEVALTEPLWASRGVAAAVARRALKAFGDYGLEDGVVLVSEGNPWQWDRQYPAAAEQSTFFAQRVRAELIDAGLPAERIRQAWLDWEQPDVPEAVRHLAALGAAQIALVPIDFLVDTLASTIDLRSAAEQASIETGIRVEIVAPLGDDPALVSALRAQIARASLTLEAPDNDADLSSRGTARG